MSRAWPALVALVLVLAMTVGVAAGAWNLASARAEAAHQRELGEIRLAHERQVQEQRDRAAEALSQLATWRAQRQPRIDTTLQALTHATTASPDWADRPIPDGVRDNLAAALAAAGARPAGGPGAALPAVGRAGP